MKMTMRGQTISGMLILLLAVCCLVPLAALAAVLYLGAPVWLVAPIGLLALVLLARRLMALLAADDSAGLPAMIQRSRRCGLLIAIGIDPVVLSSKPLTLSWHGLVIDAATEARANGD